VNDARENAGGLDVRLFGEPDVRYDGAPLKFAKRPVTLAMLALLLLKRGRPLARESLAFTLFPDSDEESALAELRRYIYLANKALPAAQDDPWIVSDGETLRWNDSNAAFVDVVEFERLAGASATRHLAIDLYAGDLLENVYEDWVLGERERLRAKYFNGLDWLIDHSRAERNFPAAIAYARRVLSADPWREDVLRSLVAVRYESGDTAGALTEYDRFAKRLRDELAIAPMPETIALRQSILRQEVVPGGMAPAASVSTGAPAPRIGSIMPFVGRQKELGQLYKAWGRAARGSAALIFLAGEAGVGKSRLTAELARSVQSEGGGVCVGTTASPEAAPYQAIVEALRSGLPLLLARRISAERRTVLAPILPELRDRQIPPVLFAESSPERETSRVHEALSFAVRSLASPRPLLLIFEDLHWAGSATVETLGAIFREAVRMPLLIVATFRREEVTVSHPLRVLERSLRGNFIEELELERFAEAEIRELVEQMEGLRETGTDVVQTLYRQSEGNALFLEGAVDAMLENRDSAVSATLRDVIATRIARLGEDARRVAEIAAVAGSGCSVLLIREVSNLSSTALASGIDELLDHRVFREAGARSGYDYVFCHHLIAEAIYSEIEPELKRQRHFRIAECLDAIFDSDGSASPREIARQYELAGSRERAGDWYLAAARSAAAVHAHGDVIELASRALESASSASLRRAALEVREIARSHRGDREGQREDIELLDDLGGGDPRAAFAVTLRRILLARALGDANEEGRLIGALEELAGELGDSERAQALTQRATHAGLCSRSAEGVEPARIALEIYERIGDLQGQLECLQLLVEFTINIGELDESHRYLSLIGTRAASLTDQAIEARALASAGRAALLRQDYRECFSLTKRALDLNLALNDREGEAASRGRLAVTAAWLGDYAFALREFDEAIAIYEALEHKRGLAASYANRTLLLMRVGLFSEALRSIERSNDLFDDVQEKRTIAANQVNASFVNAQLGNPAAAKSYAASALQITREIAYPVFEAAALANLGNAERALGEHETAIAHMEEGLAIRRSVQEPRDFVDDLADLTFAYLDAGRKDAAFATARELAVIGSASFEGAFWPQYAWWAAAQGLEAGGAESEAREARERARAELADFAGRIADERIRSAFLSVPVNRTISSDS
jgi:DNA-binding SARP family transcriptional activator